MAIAARALLGAVAYGALRLRRRPPVAAYVGLVGRRAGRSRLGCSAPSLVALLVHGSPTGADLAWALLAGLGNGFGTAFLYRGLSPGRMGVVAPVSAVGAALVPVLVGALGGERPGAPGVGRASLAALPGIWLVSLAGGPARPGRHAGPRCRRPGGRRCSPGSASGCCSRLSARCRTRPGCWPLTLSQVVSVPAVAAAGARPRGPLGAPRPRACGWPCWPDRSGRPATGLFLLATHRGFLTVSARLASLYPAITVLLAALVLNEHVHRAQGVGLGLCAVAIAWSRPADLCHASGLVSARAAWAASFARTGSRAQTGVGRVRGRNSQSALNAA